MLQHLLLTTELCTALYCYVPASDAAYGRLKKSRVASDVVQSKGERYFSNLWLVHSFAGFVVYKQPVPIVEQYVYRLADI